MKVGRNDLCPCRSGRKFKRCHLNMPPIGMKPGQTPPPPIPQHILEQFEQNRRREEARIQQFGQVREPVHIPNFSGYRIVAVRNRVYRSKNWKYFSDFLFEYGNTRFGKEWLEAQGAAPTAEQHPLYAWRREAYEYTRTQTRLPGGALPLNGALAACNNFYYDLYTVDNNGILSEDLLTRLKHRDQFQGALHELFVHATCLRAGFTIIPENERDTDRRHVEFMAVHKSTTQHILVEAKSRHRAGVMGQPGTERTLPDVRFQHLINDAVAKDPTNPLAIFVDTNLPPERANKFYDPQPTDPPRPSRGMCALIDKVCEDHSGVDPYNLLVFSNHPQHYSRAGQLAPQSRMLALISHNPRVRVFREEALVALLTAANLYGNVPSHFPPDRNAQPS